MTDLNSDLRWRWWGQTRDAVSTAAGVTIVAVETYRGTYNPVAMAFAGACLCILSSGVVGRWILGKNGNGR